MGSTNLSFLGTFYSTDAGRILASRVAHLIHASLSINNGKTLVMGFCGDYLDKLDTGNLYYAIPKSYPIVRWPQIRPFKTLVVDETMLPFSPDTWDTIILIHFMEFSCNVDEVLSELFRVLKTNGKLIIISVNVYANKFPKGILKTKNVKHHINDIIKYLMDASFSISNLFGINERFGFWPYSFSYSLNKYSELFVNVFPLLSDVIIITSEKIDIAAEKIHSFHTQCEAS
jgi:SAM-dependent methyltransferase